MLTWTELFKRISSLGIQKLLNETILQESIYNLADINNDENNNNINKESNDIKSTVSVTNSSQTIGDLSNITKYCIIDLRDNEEWEEFRIKRSF